MVDRVPSRDEPAPLAVPGFVIAERIGAGGFGEVYRAHHTLMGRDVAIKVLHARYSVDPEAVARFVAEARAVASISHAAIVDIFEFGELADHRQYCVMELVRGRTLRDVLRDRGHLPLEEAISVLHGIAEAIDAAHAAGIAHRDLKPDNVFVLDGGGVKLIDFGLAKLTGDTAEPVTKTGSVFGTPLYMSPEQCRGKATDTRTDLYSFGVLAYHVLVGEPPFSGEALELALHHLNDPPEPPTRRNRELPARVDRVVLALLAKDPARRPAPLVPAVDGLAGASFKTPARPRRWRIAMVVAALALAGAGGWLAWPRDHVAASSCIAPATRLAGVWDAPRKAALVAHFATVDRPDVATTSRFIVHDFDAFADDWSRQWTAACTASDRESDPLLYAQRQNCLERTLLDLRGIVASAFDAEPGSFSAAWNGTFFVWSTPLEDCERTDALRVMPAAPRTEVRDEVAQLVTEMHRARGETRAIHNAGAAGNFDAALARLDAATNRLDTLDAAQAAEAAMLHAWYAVAEADRVAPRIIGVEAPVAHAVEVARASIQRALDMARKYRDDRVLALDYGIVLRLALQGDPKPAEVDDALARGREARVRAGHAADEADENVDVEILRGDYERATAILVKTRASPHSRFNHWMPTDHSDTLAALYQRDGRDAEAISVLRATVAYTSTEWAGDHYMVVQAHASLGIALFDTGDAKGALDELHTALAMADRIGAPVTRFTEARLYRVFAAHALGLADERDAAARDFIVTRAAGSDGWGELGAIAGDRGLFEVSDWAFSHARPGRDLDESLASVAFWRGDLAGAEAPARRVAATVPRVTKAPATLAEFGPQDPNSAWIVAVIDAAAGRTAAADAVLAHRALLHDSPYRDGAAISMQEDSWVLIALGRWQAAHAMLERANEVASSTWHSTNSNFAALNTLLGRALVETGDSARAIPILERALYLMATAQESTLRAEASFALARALGDTHGDQARARRLAERAIAQFTPFQHARRETAIAWLAAHR